MAKGRRREDTLEKQYPKFGEFDVVKIQNPLDYGKDLIEPNDDTSEEWYEWDENPQRRAIKWDGNEYAIGAGEIQFRPWFLAKHMTKKIVDDLINHVAEGEERGKTTNIALREKYNRKVIIGVYEQIDTKSIPTAESYAIDRAKKAANNTNEDELVVTGSKIEDMSRDELRKVAKDMGIKYKATEGKKQLLKLIAKNE